MKLERGYGLLANTDGFDTSEKSRFSRSTHATTLRRMRGCWPRRHSSSAVSPEFMHEQPPIQSVRRSQCAY